VGEEKIVTVYGDVETVLRRERNRVITYESARRGGWYHPTKVWPVGVIENLKRKGVSGGEIKEILGA